MFQTTNQFISRSPDNLSYVPTPIEARTVRPRPRMCFKQYSLTISDLQKHGSSKVMFKEQDIKKINRRRKSNL